MYAKSLASSFGDQTSIRRSRPLTEDQIRSVAPSIFAEEKHDSRSKRYTCIPTIEVLEGLKKQGFEPFMVCQSRTRDDERRGHAKHMIRMRHASKIDAVEANEIILLNSHDGTSSYQMLAGVYRAVCSNGMVWGDTKNDIRVRHSGNILDNVIKGAFTVLKDFEQVDAQRLNFKGLTLNPGEQMAFSKSALALKYDTDLQPAPITETQLLRAHRSEDSGTDLWTTLNKVQENLIRGGLRGRSATGKRMTTREVTSIDQSVKLNRALWVLAEEMKKLKV